MSAERFEVVSATVETDGGRPIRVSRYTDPAAGRDVLTIGLVWLEDVVDFPAEGPDMLRLPASCATNLAEAIRTLVEDSA